MNCRFLVLALLGFLMSLSSNAQDCIATNGRSTSAKSARVEIDGSVPTSFKSGIEAGLKQWNDCNKNLVDFPWFSTSFRRGDDKPLL